MEDLTLIKVQSDYIAPMPCRIKDIKCFAVSQDEFLFLNRNGTRIINWSPTDQSMNSIKLNQKFRCFCYDCNENCYWAILECDQNIIYQLDACFCEIGQITIKDAGQECVCNINYDVCEKGIWIAYPSEVAFLDTKSKIINWYKNEDIKKNIFAILIQCGCRIECSCECNRQIMKVIAPCEEECIEIAIPKGFKIAGATFRCNEDCCSCCVYLLLSNTCNKNCIVKEYLFDFSNETQPAHDTQANFADIQCGIYEIMHSIALEEAGISHILNAEGEKIQKAVASSNSIEELVCINESVKQTLTQVTLLEGMLYSKLEALVNNECVANCEKQFEQLASSCKNNQNQEE